MSPVEFFALAFLIGLVPAGLSATLLELATGRVVCFAEPFASRNNLRKTFAVMVLAGPFMLGNDALAAWRDHSISKLALGACGAAAGMWVLAEGLLFVALAAELGALLV